MYVTINISKSFLQWSHTFINDEIEENVKVYRVTMLIEKEKGED